MGFEAEQNSAAQEVIDSLKDLPGALLPILHGIQEKVGFVPESTVPNIAEALNLSRADVHGVISFYHDFKTSKGGKHQIQVCQAESCQSVGARALTAYVKEKVGIDFHETTADGQVSLEPVYCLGNCACSPAVRIDNDVHGFVDSEKFDSLIEELSAEGAK